MKYSDKKQCMNTWLNPLKKMRNKCFEDVVKTDTSKLFCLILKLVFCGISSKNQLNIFKCYDNV